MAAHLIWWEGCAPECHFFFFSPQTRTCSGGIHHQGMGCNKYEHQCRMTDTSTRACPGRLSQGCVSDLRQLLKFWIMNASESRQQRFFFFSLQTRSCFRLRLARENSNFLTCLWLCINTARSQIISQNYLAKHGASLCVSIKWSNMADNGPGSVRTASWSSAAALCASGNDLCHSASNWDLSLPAADSYAVYSHVIPLDSRRVCTQQHHPAGREDSVDASRCTKLKFFWALPRSVNNMSRNKDGSLFLGFCFVISPCTAQISHALQIESMKAKEYIYL